MTNNNDVSSEQHSPMRMLEEDILKGHSEEEVYGYFDEENPHSTSDAQNRNENSIGPARTIVIFFIWVGILSLGAWLVFYKKPDRSYGEDDDNLNPGWYFWGSCFFIAGMICSISSQVNSNFTEGPARLVSGIFLMLGPAIVYFGVYIGQHLEIKNSGFPFYAMIVMIVVGGIMTTLGSFLVASFSNWCN